MTVIKHPSQRVGIFIDTQNLYHSARNLYDARVNFEALLKEVVSKRVLVRAVAYVIETETGEEKNFFDALTKLGIETKSKGLQVFNNNTKKADWDCGITIDMVSMAEKLDVIVLVSGDGDFIPVMDYVRKFGCQVEVATFGKSCSTKLREEADDFIDFCDSPSKFLIKRR